MTDPLTSHDDTTEITTSEEAAVLAYDTLADAGCESVVTSLPHRTRSTWIVPATSESGAWRVHIDPRSGATRVVRSEG
ncbi:hypothetical protein ACFO5R_08980 [Halosolutus amylolyticus]|uniref:PepSY domain-containing protein n=1 Tax=Halosolutus amylolyticus TaxID=2932267 RepID=A0ABD5PNE2_9EURY|nr:hypothetical protein [Halosolutus amylolyticus]